MSNSIAKCPICGKIGKIIKSNNPIVPGVCDKCLNEQIDFNNLKQANFFCRSYNLPWLPDRWIEIAKDAKQDTFDIYTTVIGDEYPVSLYNGDVTEDLWDKMNREWQKCLTHEQLLAAIKPIKESFITRMQIKWGTDFNFEDFIALEHLYTNTLASTGTTNPLVVDIIKKIAIISVRMEKELNNGEVKAAAEYSKMHKTLIDSAGLNEMIEVGETDVISTLSELCGYLEDKGFQLQFYDGCTRDIVDKTIKDQQEWMRNFVFDSTGIQQTYELIEDTYKRSMEEKASKNAFDEVGLDELLDQAKTGLNASFDAELENEDFDLGEDDAEDIY